MWERVDSPAIVHPPPSAQIDVTAAVHAQRQLQQAHALLAEEKVWNHTCGLVVSHVRMPSHLWVPSLLTLKPDRACFPADSAH